MTRKSRHARWVSPSETHLPYFDAAWPWVDKRIPGPSVMYRTRVSVGRIVGMAHPLSISYGPDWTPLRSSPSYDREWEILRPLVEGRWTESGMFDPPITQRLLVDSKFTRMIELCKLQRVYFVSNCLHRVAAAHLLRRRWLTADVLPFRLRSDAPEGLRAWLRSLPARTAASK
jgi:hypothetical protein